MGILISTKNWKRSWRGSCGRKLLWSSQQATKPIWERSLLLWAGTMLLLLICTIMQASWTAVAHAVGVLGDGGRGTAEHFGLENEVDLIMGTHSKSLAAIGGFIAGPSEVINWIKHLGRSMVFRASLPPSLVASVSAALDIIEEQPELRARLWRNTHKMLRGYKTLGYDTETREMTIIPILIKDTMKTYQMCKLLFENGIFVNPVVSPGVPQGR